MTNLCIKLAFFAVTAGGVQAADTFYLGAWKIASAAPAPWAGKEYKPDTAEMKALVAKTIIIGPKSITGPRALVCSGAKYKVVEYTADMLFQGGLGEMHSRNASADPVKLAAAIGFKGSRVKTLETGCEIDFHFIDPATAAIALNNYIYTLKKQP